LNVADAFARDDQIGRIPQWEHRHVAA
jgi:hypothetical protein